MGLTPMMSQYVNTKEKYKDCILLYRLGDFYEMFFEDAEICARELEITLTGKDCGLEKRAPMCGIPHHAANNYIQRLVEKGYKVAICEQVTQPQKGVKLVEREVLRVITPGTIMDSSMLDENNNNYLCSIYKDKDNIGIATIDITTGKFEVTEFQNENILSKTNDYLVSIKPSEVILNGEMKSYYDMLPCVASQYIPNADILDDKNFDFEICQDFVKKQLNVDSLKLYNLNNRQYAIISAGALLAYILETQKRQLSHINDIEFYNFNDYMQLDANTRRNLELTETLRDRKKKGSLFWAINKTKTSMGARLLKSYIDQPLYNDKLINNRLNSVDELVKNIVLREKIGDILYKVYDLERLCGRISYNNLVCSDCISLKNSLNMLPELKKSLSSFTSENLINICNDIFDFSHLSDLIERAIVDKNGEGQKGKDTETIKYGYNKELDEYIDISKSGKQWIAKLEAKEKEETGIKNLKINYNKVFGYYIEVTNSQMSLIPYHYVRKQTLANCERFITPELKEIEDKILNADSMKEELEKRLFNEIRNILLSEVDKIKITAKAVAQLDVLLSFATISMESNYCRPLISKKNKNIEIIGGRHPVVELINRKEEFIPNDTILNDTDARTMIITGPNMAGKSTYMRQVALITLLAHIGCYVPAKSANYVLLIKFLQE